MVIPYMQLYTKYSAMLRSIKMSVKHHHYSIIYALISISFVPVYSAAVTRLMPTMNVIDKIQLLKITELR